MSLKRTTMDTALVKVKYKVVSTRGHTDCEEDAEIALDNIRDLCENEAKWAMIDGDFVNPSDMTIDMLVDAEDITLINSLVGGR